MSGSLGVGYRIGGRYELVRRIARGGMAEVWEAEDTILTRPVAVKILLAHLAADEAFVTRFRREAVAAARLSHPHIVSIYDTCAGDDCEAIVMELVRGRTLREVLDQQGALPVRQAVDIAMQVADALAHAHLNGLIHRDVKPGNILLSDDGRVLVADFGIAKAAEASADLTEVGQVVGTAKYLAPEQVQGHALDARSDMYALAIVLYEMLCGRVPFTGENSTSTALARLTTDPLRPRQVRAGIPRAVEDVVLRAMARKPDDRYPGVAEMRGALLNIDLSRVDDEDGTAAVLLQHADPTPVPGAPESFARRERSWLVPAALIIVVAVTLAVVSILVGRTEVGQDLFGDGDGAAASDEPVQVGTPAAFDPEGDGAENGDTLRNLTDGDTGTIWRTERYDDQFGGPGALKDGVGVVLPLAQAAELGRLTVESPDSGWTASVYVADAAGDELSDWGEPLETLEGPDTVDLDGRRGGAVMVWITRLPSDASSFRLALSEIRLTG